MRAGQRSDVPGMSLLDNGDRDPLMLPGQGSVIGYRPRRLASWQVDTAMRLLRSGLGRPVTIAEIAGACRLSPCYFIKAFTGTGYLALYLAHRPPRGIGLRADRCFVPAAGADCARMRVLRPEPPYTHFRQAAGHDAGPLAPIAEQGRNGGRWAAAKEGGSMSLGRKGAPQWARAARAWMREWKLR